MTQQEALNKLCDAIEANTASIRLITDKLRAVNEQTAGQIRDILQRLTTLEE